MSLFILSCVAPVDNDRWSCFVSEYLETRDERSGGGEAVRIGDGGRMDIFDATVRYWQRASGYKQARISKRP
jgi:hypothetical protein